MPIFSKGGGFGAGKPGTSDKIKYKKPPKGTKTVSALNPMKKKGKK